MSLGFTAEIRDSLRRLLPVWLLPAWLALAGLLGGGCEERNDNPWHAAARAPDPDAPRPSPVVKVLRPAPARKFRPSQVRTAFQTVEGSATDDMFGHTVAGAGDVNHDGYADVLVGSFGAGSDKAGEVALYYGSAKGIGKTPAWKFTCPVAAAEFGHQVEGVGDVNRDGYDDFIVGATYYSEPGKPGRTGGAFLFLGGPNGPAAQPDWRMVGEEPGSSTGFAVAAAGDVNGDGYADVLVGAYKKTNGTGTNEARGRVYLYLGGPGGLSRDPVWTPPGERIGSNYGYTLHGIGDVNHDGYDDVAVGSWGYESDNLNSGRVYVYYGGKAGPSLAADWTLTGAQAGQLMGNSVFGAGDVNGDGYDDLLVAANNTSHPEQYEGMVLLFYGGPGGLGRQPAWTFEPDQPLFHLGHSVATAGDVNGDGFADVILSAMNGRQRSPDEGVVFVFHGSAKGLARRPDWTFHGGQAHGGYGATVRCAGDVDGDGYDDLVVGQTHFSGNIPNQGRAWVHYGSAKGLAESSDWGSGVEAAGFTYLNLTVPWPNRVWIATTVGLAGTALLLLSRAYYRRRERRVLTLQQAKEETQRAERHRLSQDLHDQLGAELTEIVLAGANARRQLGTGGAVDAKLAQIETTAGRLVTSLAEIVWLTKPTNDTLGHLADYLGDLAVTTLEKADFACALAIPTELPDTTIPYDLRHDLVLSVREALHNAIKHSGGDRVSLVIRVTTHALEISVRDNGRGFAGPATGRKGNGLSNMTSRLTRHGGTLQLQPSPTGTAVTFTVPFPNRNLEVRP